MGQCGPTTPSDHSTPASATVSAHLDLQRLLLVVRAAVGVLTERRRVHQFTTAMQQSHLMNAWSCTRRCTIRLEALMYAVSIVIHEFLNLRYSFDHGSSN